LRRFCHGRAGFRDRHQRRLLEVRRAGHGINKIRNQIGPPLINRLHVGPSFVHFLVQSDEAIVRSPEKKTDDKTNEQQNDDETAATNRKFIHKIDT